MAILVTGGTGLVGSRLLRRFVDAGSTAVRSYAQARKFLPAPRAWRGTCTMRIR